jgi:hypothetical protein
MKGYRSHDIVCVLKTRRLQCTTDTAKVEETKNTHRILVKKPAGNSELGRQRRIGRITLS